MGAKNSSFAATARPPTRAAARPHLVHISTAYVGGMLRGLVREEMPLDAGMNWRHEAAVLTGLRPVVEEESRSPEVLNSLRRQARLGVPDDEVRVVPGLEAALAAAEAGQLGGPTAQPAREVR